MPDPDLRPAERLGIAALVALAALVLLWPPLVGVANSGDFERTMSWGGIWFWPGSTYAQNYFNWIQPTYAWRFGVPLGLGWYFTSEGLLIKVAAFLGYLADWRAFDLRWMGVVHLAAYAGALWLLFRGWRRAFGTSGLWLLPGLALILGDVGYTAYFHSFYSEAAGIIFLVATLGLGLELAGTPPDEVDDRLLHRFFVALGLFMTAKTQHLTLILPIFLYAAWLWWRHPAAPWRGKLPRLAGALLVLAGVQFAVNPPNMTEANKFASVFNGILKDSPDPRQDLIDLGLDPGLAPLAGQAIFAAERPPLDVHGEAFRAAFFARHSHRKTIGFYLTHPDRFLDKMRRTAANAYTLRIRYMGNFAEATGLPPLTKADRWSAWGRFKAERLPHTLPFTAACGALAAAALALAALLDRPRLRRGPACFGLAVVGMAAIAFVTPVMGDGESDFEKHMFLFGLLFDLGLVLASGWLLGLLARTAAGPGSPTPAGSASDR